MWKVPAGGGAPVRLTKEPGDYVDPVWSPDGKSVIVARGEGATARQRTLTHNAWYDLVRISATPPAGGDTGVALATITRPSGAAISRRSRAGRSCGRRSDRRAGSSGSTRVAGARRRARRHGAACRSSADGSDKQEHLSFPSADEIVPSPDGE